VVSLATVKSGASAPPTVTLVTPVNPVPVRVTVSPTAAFWGAMPVTAGLLTASGTKVKFEELEQVRPLVATVMTPVAEPAFTLALIVFESMTMKLEATALPKVTWVAPENPVPVRVTRVPEGPVAGVKAERVGVTRKRAAEVAVPRTPVSWMKPEAAAAGTWTLIAVSLATVK